MFVPFYSTLFVLLFSIQACHQTKTEVSDPQVEQEAMAMTVDTAGMETAYFASGCFWCVEAIFESVEGVGEAVSGYSGGKAADADYSSVSAGRTDHAEAVEVYYDADKIDYTTLLEVFFGSHDPTTLNRQGPDRGRQYRSAIFYKNEDERRAALNFIKQLEDDGVFPKGSITTEVVAFDAFYPAEDYHQNYERRNPNQPYVKAVSIPRLRKFQAAFPHLLKSANH